MSIPDQFEQVGIVIGSMIVLGLPTSLMTNVLYGPDMAYPLIGIWFVPGFVIGVLIATGGVPFEYRDVWYVGVVGWVLALLGLTVLGIPMPTDRSLIAVVTIAVALAAALGLSRLRLGRFLPP